MIDDEPWAGCMGRMPLCACVMCCQHTTQCADDAGEHAGMRQKLIGELSECQAEQMLMARSLSASVQADLVSCMMSAHMVMAGMLPALSKLT